MASKFKASITLFLSINLPFFVLVSSSGDVHNPLNDDPSTGVGGIVDDLLNGITGGNSHDYSHGSSNPVIIRPGDRFTNIGDNMQGRSSRCNPLNLGVCLNLLGGLLNLDVRNVPTQPCCSLIQGLADLEVAVCLCTAIRANVLDIIKLDLPISLSLLLNDCGRGASTDYICSP